MSYGGDVQFLPRLKKLLDDFPGQAHDAWDVATDLKQRHPEYERKNSKAFLRMVTEALERLGRGPPKAEEAEAGSDRKSSENRKRKLSNKAKKKGAEVVVLDSENEEDPDSEKYVSYPDTNRANLTLANLYAGGTGKPSQALQKAPSTPSSSQPKRSSANKAPGSAVKGSNMSKPRGLGAVLEVEPKFSDIKFNDMGGCNRQFLEVCRMVLKMMKPRTYSTFVGCDPPKGLLINGPPGCGKTMFAQAIPGEFGIHMIRLAATELVSGVSGETEDKVRQLFEAAKRYSPCFLIIDDIDAITPKKETASREMERRIVTQLCNSLDELFTRSKDPRLEERLEFGADGDIKLNGNDTPEDPRVLVIGTTSRPDALDIGLRRRFDLEIALGIPDEYAREKIISVICKLPLDDSINVKMLARWTPGYVGADLKALMSAAANCAISRIFDTMVKRADQRQRQLTNAQVDEELGKVLSFLNSDDDPETIDRLGGFHVSMADFERAIELVQPSAKREGFATVPDVTWDDIGALSDVRCELDWSILKKVKRPEDFELLGIPNKPQGMLLSNFRLISSFLGILLCGPPGCGKTLLAKAVANEAGINFISVKGPELLNMYVGESERAVRTVFGRARDSSPCVIFFDELDALCPVRSQNESSGGARLVNQLLTEMDGVEARKQVFLIGATNRPDMIDPAILRPGRLDKIVFVDFPSGPDRADILRKSTKNGTEPRLAPSFDVDTFATDPALDGYTGADLTALIHEASIIALKQRFAENSEIDAVDTDHFRQALAKIRPSVSKADRAKYERMKKEYTKDTSKAAPPTPAVTASSSAMEV
ncbi:unnamed protein product, partial [Mesorhabditis spiculigera]